MLRSEQHQGRCNLTACGPFCAALHNLLKASLSWFHLQVLLQLFHFDLAVISFTVPARCDERILFLSAILQTRLKMRPFLSVSQL